jgi:hypothetical protein
MKLFAYALLLVGSIGLSVGCGSSAPTEVVGGGEAIPADIQAEYDRIAAEEEKNANN